MIVWLDAQLPPMLAPWMRAEFGVGAFSLKALGLRDAKDREIVAAARIAGAVLPTKDSDFVDLVQRLGTPPQVVWLTCGNVTNARLRTVLVSSWPQVTALLAAGEAVVELGDETEVPGVKINKILPLQAVGSKAVGWLLTTFIRP
jgi:predicted nuclease of predicted toxin-antitoxin system